MSLGTLSRPAFPQRSLWLGLGLLVLFVGFSIQYADKVRKDTTRSAILRWTPPLRGLWQGEDIYLTYSYPNPPIMAILLSPLATLPPVVEALVWYYLKAGMTVLSLFWVFRLIQGAGVEFPAGAKAGTVLLSVWPLMGDLTHGNVNLFILFLVTAALFLFHQGRTFPSGVLIALAIACKVTPALFVPYFVWKRSGKALLGVAAGLVLFLGLIPASVLGVEHNNALFKSWWMQMVEPYLGRDIVYSEQENQSLPGVVVRVLTHSPSATRWAGDHYVPVCFDNVMDLDPHVAGWLVKACMLAYVGLVVLVCRTPTAPPTGWRLAAEFGFVVLGMLLFSERTWKHHCVTLVIPFAVLLFVLASVPLSVTGRRYVMASLAAAAVLMAAASIRLPEHWIEGSRLAHVYGAYLWANLVLLAALAFVLRLPPTDPEPS